MMMNRCHAEYSATSQFERGHLLEAIFFYPWGAVFQELSWFGFGAMFVFTIPLAIGLIYEWMKGGLEW